MTHISKIRYILIMLLLLCSTQCDDCDKNPVAPEPVTTTTTSIEDVIIESPIIPRPRDEPLYMIGFYSPCIPQADTLWVAELPEYGINGIRIFTDNPWNGWTIYKGRNLEIDFPKIEQIRNFIEYCNGLGIIVQMTIFNRSAVQTGWHWDLNWFYSKENWSKHRELVKAFTKELNNCVVLYEIDNEGHGGYEFEKMVYDLLESEGIPRRYISSSPVKGASQIEPMVGLYGIHGMYSSRFWSCNYSGLHYIYSSDGAMEGSSGIYQFNERKWGAYPTPDEMEKWVTYVIYRDANFEFNLSGLIEPNGHTLPPFGYKLLNAIKRAIKKQ